VTIGEEEGDPMIRSAVAVDGHRELAKGGHRPGRGSARRCPGGQSELTWRWAPSAIGPR